MKFNSIFYLSLILCIFVLQFVWNCTEPLLPHPATMEPNLVPTVPLGMKMKKWRKIQKILFAIPTKFESVPPDLKVNHFSGENPLDEECAHY